MNIYYGYLTVVHDIQGPDGTIYEAVDHYKGAEVHYVGEYKELDEEYILDQYGEFAEEIVCYGNNKGLDFDAPVDFFDVVSEEAEGWTVLKETFYFVPIEKEEH